PPAEMRRHPYGRAAAVDVSSGFDLRRCRLFPTDRDAGGARVTERPESGGGRNVFALGWRSPSSAAIKFQLRAASAAEVLYGCSSPRQHRTQRLLHHRFHLSEAEPVSVGENGAALH